MPPITYSLPGLTPHATPSESYYHDVRAFSDLTMREGERRLGSIVRRFRQHLQTCNADAARSTAELVLDLLVLGVLWRAHQGQASRIHPGLSLLIAAIGRQRQRGGWIKRAVDHVRAVLNTLLLQRRKSDWRRVMVPVPAGLFRLICWLEATAEYRREAERLALWQAWFVQQEEGMVDQVLYDAIDYAAWFEASSKRTLGQYTCQVPSFLSQLHNYRWREDIISVSKPRVEYHLAMVGAEVMNQAFRDDFLRCQRRVLLVPGCMRTDPSRCEAVAGHRGSTCTACTARCRIHALTQMGIKLGFDVVMLHHASDLSVWAPRPNEPSTGIIGVACMAALLAGGWELRALGIPAQCVPLDGCGCKAHWDPVGRPTRMSTRELKRLIGCSDPASPDLPQARSGKPTLRLISSRSVLRAC